MYIFVLYFSSFVYIMFVFLCTYVMLSACGEIFFIYLSICNQNINGKYVQRTNVALTRIINHRKQWMCFRSLYLFRVNLLKS